MKMIQLMLIVVLMAGSASCVSKKKFKELSKRYSSLDSSYNSLNALYGGLTGKYEDLSKKSTDYQKMSKSELEQLNRELEKKIADLEASNKRVAELQSAIQKQKEAQKQLLQKIKDALVAFNPNELSAEIRKDGRVYVSLSEKLLFKSGSYKVDPRGKEALGKLAGVLTNQPDIDITIEGHTDSIPFKKGELKDNLDLSVMRATSIVRILKDDYGVRPQQLYASGRGEYFPASDNKSEEGRAMNRRTEIILSPKISELFKILEQQ